MGEYASTFRVKPRAWRINDLFDGELHDSAVSESMLLIAAGLMNVKGSRKGTFTGETLCGDFATLSFILS